VEKIELLEGKLYQCHFTHQKSQMDSPEIESRPQRRGGRLPDPCHGPHQILVGSAKSRIMKWVRLKSPTRVNRIAYKFVGGEI